MRYIAMQVLTWGTIAGAVGSALLLAAIDRPGHTFNVDGSVVVPPLLIPRGAPPQAGTARKPAVPKKADDKAAETTGAIQAMR